MEEAEEKDKEKDAILYMHWLLAYSPEGDLKVAWLTEQTASCEKVNNSNKVVAFKMDFGDLQ